MEVNCKDGHIMFISGEEENAFWETEMKCTCGADLTWFEMYAPKHGITKPYIRQPDKAVLELRASKFKHS